MRRGIAFDDRVGPLLKGKPDIDAKGMFGPGAFVRRVHDAPPPPVMTMYPASAKFPAELLGHLVTRLAGRNPGRSEDRDLALCPIGGKNF